MTESAETGDIEDVVGDIGDVIGDVNNRSVAVDKTQPVFVKSFQTVVA